MATRWWLRCRPVLHALLFGAGAGCGEVLEPGPTDDDTGAVHAFPPCAPESAVRGDGPGVVLAISSVRLGRSALDGGLDEEAWKDIGFDLDGVITADGRHRTCSGAGAPYAAAHQDGHAGRDNSFGRNILPMIQALAGSAEERTNEDIDNGEYTLLLDIEGVARSPEYIALQADVYDGAKRSSGPPAWEGDDVRSPTFESVYSRDPMISLAPIHGSYVRADDGGGTWVGRSEGRVTFRVAMSPKPDLDKVVRLTVRRPLIALRFEVDRASGAGTMTGVLRPEEVHAEIRRVMALHHAGACHGEGVDGVRHQIQGAADTLEDGAIEPDSPCDAISFGIELEAIRVRLGRVAPPAAPPADPCH